MRDQGQQNYPDIGSRSTAGPDPAAVLARSHRRRIPSTLLPQSIGWRMAVPLLSAVFAVCALAWPPAPRAQAGATPEEGAKVFQQFCVACHTIGGGRLIGPDLKGVADRRTRDWLVRFIDDPAPMLVEDPDAIALLKEYTVPMVDMGLTPEQIDAVVAWFETAQAAPKGMPAQYIPTLAISVLVVIALTWIGFAAGKKKVDGEIA